MKTSDFYYDLPQELIAQTPISRRDGSRMMVLPKNDGEVLHRHFYDLPDLLSKGDLLVLNDSRVLPARLIGAREDTGSPVELLLLSEKEGGRWECIVRPGKRCREGHRFSFGEGLLRAEVETVLPDGNRIVRFEHEGIFLELLDRLGQMPLPPYITERLEDPERYQTVYAKNPGSAAAPTAGLHFTDEVFARLKEKGIRTAFVTLHVGLGTFRPVKEEDIEDHPMHEEFYTVPEETADLIRETRAAGGRIIAVGTTSCRTLETAAQKYGEVRACSGMSGIFIYPGYEFKAIDGLVTNFHLPESTLIMLISALAGRERVLAAYAQAVRECYRFFSFGDAMLIL